MNDGGIDADTLSSTLEYLLNAPSNDELCPIKGGPIDLGLPYHKTGNDLRIEGYDPEIGDSEESSDEEVAGASLSRDIKQASGNFSNAFIEERWSERCQEENSKSDSKKAELKKRYDMLRESVLSMSLQKNRVSPMNVGTPLEEQRQEKVEVTKTNQSHNIKTKKKRPKHKNVAIDSLLGIKKALEQVPTETATASSSTTVKVFVNGVTPIVVNGITSTRRGRGRFSDNSHRSNPTMIRRECINGYDADPNYDPNNVGNSAPALNEFPAL